ncbi:MAG: leucyl aminopeptidase family protein [Bacteroidales bacterium]|jgi:leucyl aminopeptidase|nr:leucyl aminopeptidase family protein [Bacteroidales bacterium]
MALSIQHIAQSNTSDRILLIEKNDPLDALQLNQEVLNFVKNQKDKLKKELVELNQYDGLKYLLFYDKEMDEAKRLEWCRKNGAKINKSANSHGIATLLLESKTEASPEILAVAEGLALANYQFLKYRKDAAEKKNSLQKLEILAANLDQKKLEHLNIAVEANCWARDLVNEPLNKLSAVDLAEQISTKFRAVGGKAEVFNKQKIEALKMGGLLSVNKGSVDPPTFTILEWKPENAKNSKPIVLVGKGVVYDTGGLSLKPSNAMDTMKCDMGGAAAVAASIYAVASAKLPIHVIALVPATDNRPDGNAYVPGDVITMFDGTTVEVLNTDAEGRLILADALTYAKKFSPEIVFNFATLTGAAARAIGSQGIVAMEVRATEMFCDLAKSGNLVHERLVKFPMWDEYREQLNSEIADLKNIGGTEGGAITAGKFLEHFTDYPFVHFDIAGPAFIDKRDSYRGIGGTGIGVRLMFHYLNEWAEKL